MLCLAEMPNKDRTRARLLRGIEHIEQEAGGEVSLAEISSHAALSDYHFHRQFRAYFGLPVMDYVRRRRLARAAGALLATHNPVLHIAMDAGFQSQAAFTRAFRKVYHITPAAWRARGLDVPWLSSAPIDEAALAMFPGLGKGQPRLEVIEGFDIAGIVGTFAGAERREQITRLNRQLFAQAEPGSLAMADLIGVSGGNEAVLGGMLDYMTGRRIASGETLTGGLAGGLERRSIPGGAYLVFTFEGDWAKLPAAYDFIFANWMPGSRHALRGTPNFDCRPLQHGDSGGSIEIWIPVESA